MSDFKFTKLSAVGRYCDGKENLDELFWFWQPKLLANRQGLHYYLYFCFFTIHVVLMYKCRVVGNLLEDHIRNSMPKACEPKGLPIPFSAPSDWLHPVFV